GQYCGQVTRVTRAHPDRFERGQRPWQTGDDAPAPEPAPAEQFLDRLCGRFGQSAGTARSIRVLSYFASAGGQEVRRLARFGFDLRDANGGAAEIEADRRCLRE